MHLAAVSECLCMEMASQLKSKTSEVASAINSLLHLEKKDQASLLDVIHHLALNKQKQ